MQSLVNLYNQALTAVGHGKLLTDPNENTREAVICRLWFPPALSGVLNAFHWPSAKFVQRLALVSERGDAEWEPTDPLPGYLYAYRLPNDCVRPQHLHDFSRFALSGGNVLSTNTDKAILYYTKRVELPAEWEEELYNAVVFSLAAHLNMAFSGKPNVTQLFENKVTMMLERSATNAANSDDEYYDAFPTTWAGTGFSANATAPLFIYPTQAFAVAA